MKGLLASYTRLWTDTPSESGARAIIGVMAGILYAAPVAFWATRGVVPGLAVSMLALLFLPLYARGIGDLSDKAVTVMHGVIRR